MNISVIGLWRDSEPYIQRTLSQLDDLLSLENFNFTFYFYENDSIDSTKKILEDWCKNKPSKLTSEKLNFPKFGSVIDINRLVLLSVYRNKLKTTIDYDASDFTLMIDTDIIFTKDNFLTLYSNIISLNAAMVCANIRQIGIKDCIMDQDIIDSFYDVFALRDSYNNDCLYFADCPLILNSDRKKWTNNEPVRINAGFSGLSLIKTNVLEKCFWSTYKHSEHINFCHDVSRHGDIYIIPSCKPKTEVDLSRVTSENYLIAQQRQREVLNNFNRAYEASIRTDLALTAK